MNHTITIKDGKITTKLYEKSLNLYLYIPPHSAHPPGVLNEIIFGQIHCIFTLCSERNNISKSINQFYIRLIQKGYKCKKIMPIFNEAIHHNSLSMILQHSLHQKQHILPPMTPKYTFMSSSTLVTWHPIKYSRSGKPMFQIQKQTSNDLNKKQDWLSHPHPSNDRGLLKITKPG
eukprot:8321182-Ditylum_brightwellii.AAC.1